MLAYVDCFCGVAGDMLLGALIDAGAPAEEIRRAMRRLKVRADIRVSRVMRGPIRCTNAVVRPRAPKKSHAHTSAREILSMIRRSGLPAEVRRNATEIFTLLARAEGKIHGVDPAKVSFHEVGAVDSIVDVVGACVALHLLEVDEVSCSPVPMSRGTVKARHGTIPVPAPATLELLKGFPLVETGIEAEIVTPTGAGILAALVRSPGRMPPMRLRRTGYGAGDYALEERPDFLRVLIGESVPAAGGDVAVLVETNLDDLPGEDIGYLFDTLFEKGALDVFTTPIQMKKSRPAVQLSVLVPPSLAEAVEKILLTETTTFGVRRQFVERSKLDREIVPVKTRFGRVRVKVGSLGGRILKAAPEYEDLRTAARRHGVPLSKVRSAAVHAYHRKRP